MDPVAWMERRLRRDGAETRGGRSGRQT
jgi:hypothetical protein